MYSKIFVSLVRWKKGKGVMTFSLAVGYDDLKVQAVVWDKSRYAGFGLGP